MASLRYILKVVSGKAGFSLWNTWRVNKCLFPHPVAKLMPVKVGRHVDLRGLERGSIVFRDGVKPHKYMLRIGCESWPMYSPKSMVTWMWFHKGATLVVGDECDFCAGSRLVITANASVCVGDDFFINNNALLYCTRSIVAGDHCCIGWDAQVYDSDFHLVESSEAPADVLNPPAPVAIGDNVWISNRCTVAKGSVIPSNSVIASGSLVNKVLGVPGLYAGTPAVLKKEGVQRIWDKKIESKLRKRIIND